MNLRISLNCCYRWYKCRQAQFYTIIHEWAMNVWTESQCSPSNNHQDVVVKVKNMQPLAPITTNVCTTSDGDLFNDLFPSIKCYSDVIVSREEPTQPTVQLPRNPACTTGCDLIDRQRVIYCYWRPCAECVHASTEFICSAVIPSNSISL